MCKIAKSREWGTRIYHEKSYFSSAVFSTLTYEDMPKNQSLNKIEIQNYIKRLRKAVSPQKIKHFTCGEYGVLNKRPHYHLILLGLSNDSGRNGQPQGVDTRIIHETWSKGRTHHGSVTAASIRYVADYVFKAWTDKSKYSPEIEAPFLLASQGMGKRFALDNRKQIIDQLGVTIQGTRVGLPKYYVNCINKSQADGVYYENGKQILIWHTFITPEMIYERTKEREKEINKNMLRKYGGRFIRNGHQQAERVQREVNIIAKNGLKNRNKL